MDNVSGNNENLSGEDSLHIDFCKKYNTILDYETRVKLYYSNTGLIPPLKDDEKVVFYDGYYHKLTLAPSSTSETISWKSLFLERYILIETSGFICRFETKFKKQENQKQQLKLIIDSINAVDAQYEKEKQRSSFFYKGFSDCAKRHTCNFQIHQDEELTLKDLEEYINGQKFCKIETQLKYRLRALIDAIPTDITNYLGLEKHPLIPNYEKLLSEHNSDTVSDFVVDAEQYTYKLCFAELRARYSREEIPIRKYRIGFLKGLMVNLIPYVDTPDNRKERIVNTIGYETPKFPERIKVGPLGVKEYYLDPEDVFEYGKLIGQHSVAWEKIMETPGSYQEFLNKRAQMQLQNTFGSKLNSEKYVAPKFTVDQCLAEATIFFNECEIINFETAIDFLFDYFTFLMKEVQRDFINQVLKLLETRYKDKMPFQSDLIRIERQLLSFTRAGVRPFEVTQNSSGAKTVHVRVGPQKPELNQANIFKPRFYNIVKFDPQNDTGSTDFIKNTVDEYLENLKGVAINERDYEQVLQILSNFFTEGDAQGKTSFFVRNGNKKKLGSALGDIYKSLRDTPLSFEYLTYCKSIFLCFKDEQIEKSIPTGSRLYKYFTSKTQ